jgi:hypothetical protein
MNLFAAGNTYNPSLIVLKRKGYQLWAKEYNGGVLWMASKDQDSFSADSPPELLGLVVLAETLGDAWNQQEPNLLGELLDSASE